MPIPSQNEFLLPFLTILSDGQTYKRSQMMFKLAKHFNISEEEAQNMSGNQFTLVSRVAWCDVHFCKAGLAEKRQHHSYNLQTNGAKDQSENSAILILPEGASG